MSDHLTRREAAQMLTISVSWLEAHRDDGVGPPCHHVPGSRRVYYVRSELEDWLAGIRHDHVWSKWVASHETGSTESRLDTNSPTEGTSPA
jgi:hypothetical protein